MLEENEYVGTDILDEITDENARRAAQERIKILTAQGNLTPAEINMYIKYEFIELDMRLVGQVNRYYLKLKSQNPYKAEEMRSYIYNMYIGTLDDVERLCRILYDYISGAVIYFEGKEYTVSQNTFYRIDPSGLIPVHRNEI